MANSQRYTFMSDTLIPFKVELPTWFTEKYDGVITFTDSIWTSTNEGTFEDTWKELPQDVQRLIQELNPYTDIRLVFFTDESPNDWPSVKYFYINFSEIDELEVADWRIILHKELENE